MKPPSIAKDKLALNEWDYRRFFVPADAPMHSVVKAVEDYIVERDLASHAFFDVASRQKSALELWLSQELVMTNAFSQIVLAAASGVQNVHIRSILVEVAAGEHGHVRAGVAKRAHPWLLHRLGESVGLSMDKVHPARATLDLIRNLEEKCQDNTLAALAWIGVGNERLILPEYEGIKRCFATMWPEADYEPFLQANLTEDVVHSRLCYQAASSLIRDEADCDRYYREATASVDARCRYFDSLLQEVVSDK